MRPRQNLLTFLILGGKALAKMFHKQTCSKTELCKWSVFHFCGTLQNFFCRYFTCGLVNYVNIIIFIGSSEDNANSLLTHLIKAPSLQKIVQQYSVLERTCDGKCARSVCVWWSSLQATACFVTVRIKCSTRGLDGDPGERSAAWDGCRSQPVREMEVGVKAREWERRMDCGLDDWCLQTELGLLCLQLWLWSSRSTSTLSTHTHTCLYCMYMHISTKQLTYKHTLMHKIMGLSLEPRCAITTDLTYCLCGAIG